jgi:hypothetical protein
VLKFLVKVEKYREVYVILSVCGTAIGQKKPFIAIKPLEHIENNLPFKGNFVINCNVGFKMML